ncbi:SDR family NAD(P)-dependent oxidoreductase [Candidatus Neomarinimicrobiota bacterium]
MINIKNKLKSFLSINKRTPHFNNVDATDNHKVVGKKYLAGKNALITGAGKNIGHSIALELADHGANIYFTDIDPGNLSNLKEKLKSKNVKCQGFLSDGGDKGDIEILINSLKKDKIHIDVLINNLGIKNMISSILDTDWDEIERIYRTNVYGPTYLTKLITQQMIDNNIKGSIIFISSIHQWSIRRFWMYSSSKASIGMLIKELAVELAPHEIRVNGIAPGWVWEAEDGSAVPSDANLLHRSSINPSYIGRAVVFLAADYFSYYTTGSVLKIDAGLSLFNKSLEEIPTAKE